MRIAKGLHQHYKGGLYSVLHVSKPGDVSSVQSSYSASYSEDQDIKIKFTVDDFGNVTHDKKACPLDLVIYQSCETQRLWARPQSMWYNVIQKEDGQKVLRLTPSDPSASFPEFLGRDSTELTLLASMAHSSGMICNDQFQSVLHMISLCKNKKD